MKIIKEEYLNTHRYGKLKFIKTEKGWFWQYDIVLLWGVDVESNDIIKYLDEDAQESGEYIPYLENCDEFFETLQEAKEDCMINMSNLFHLGLIAVWR